MSYTEDHLDALADIREAGASVTFTRVMAGSHDAVTETFGAPTTSTVTGAAIRVRGDRDAYIRLGLVYSKHPTLLFAPDTFGELPEAGDTVVWSGKTYTVKEVGPVAPDGTAIMARVVCE